MVFLTPGLQKSWKYDALSQACTGQLQRTTAVTLLLTVPSFRSLRTDTVLLSKRSALSLLLTFLPQNSLSHSSNLHLTSSLFPRPCLPHTVSHSLPSQILCLFCYCFLAGLIFIDVNKPSHYSGLAVMGLSLLLGGWAYREHGLGRTPQWPWASALSGAKRPCWAVRSFLQSSLWSVSVTSRVGCFLVLFLCLITTTDWFLLVFI